MILTILRLLVLIPTAFRLRSELALENLALPQQLAVFKAATPTAQTSEIGPIIHRILSEVEETGCRGAHPTATANIRQPILLILWFLF
ncbi:MAG: hypothetical protein FJW35_07415 [Acidobacteria bacterium]|nr:hypothetical protein [Acidobacteriota bacterium]